MSLSAAANAAIAQTIEVFHRAFTPPPDFSLSDWADAERMLSPEASALPGKWKTDNFAPQRSIMDAISDPLIEKIVVMSATQVGKTECGVINPVGYYIAHDPSPILVVQPTLEMAKTWSRDRLEPMIRDTPCLRGKVKDARTRDSKNTILHKLFPGGHITVCGANSPASLASRPIRILLLDEVDRYPASAGAEGDPANLAKKRTATYWNRKIVMVSSPTIKNFSRIEAAYEESDQRRFYVPCIHCWEFQTLKWAQVQWPEGQPEEAVYVCEHCGAEITNHEKNKMVRDGEWRATAEFSGAAGFHLNEIYSPWVSLGEMAINFLEAKKLPETLQTFVNTSLAETWEEEGEQISDQGLYGRRENYGPEIPYNAGLLTAGVDVQNDRIEVEILGWGLNYETWSIDYRIIPGDPEKPQIWQNLSDLLLSRWMHDSGYVVKIAATGIDTGHKTQQVYNFCKPRYKNRVFALKGSNQPGRPIVSRPTKSNLAKLPLFQVGTDTAKDSIFSRLRIGDHGPGYCHFPDHYDEEYFLQLTAEKRVTRYTRGVAHTEYVQTRSRNEALDCRVYNLAAYAIINPNMEQILKRVQSGSTPPPASPQKRPGGRRVINEGVKL